MSLGPSRDCGRHREALIAFVDRRALGPGSDEALDHLGRCGRCARELQDTALAIAALRRLGRESQAIEPPPDAWARLQARVQRPRETLWRWRAGLAGLALSSALVGLIMGPSALWTSRQVYLQETGLATGISQVRLAEERAESLILAQQLTARAVPLAASFDNGLPAPTAAEAGWRGPVRTTRRR
jgi:hypothetical protein